MAPGVWALGTSVQLRLPAFPNPVNEVAARTVAAGVVLMALGVLAGQRWLLLPLAYGFVARVLAGPRFSPLGLVATRIVAPRLAARPVPGPPKRFAQAIGATFTLAALALDVAGAGTAANVLVALVLVAALLESALAFCIGCRAFALLMRAGVIPASVCAECADITRRLAA
jgi:hypothetical protein